MKKAGIFFTLVIIGTAVGILLLTRPAVQPPIAIAQKQIPVAPRASAPVVVEQTPVTEPPPAPRVKPATQPKKVAQVPAQNNPPANAGNELQDPQARDALALVGLDPGAERYWLEAIFDSDLPNNERADLMEDLNETGFADPNNLTSDDVPLIVSRLQVIAAVLPSADDFMTEHLMEAQKDLKNMLGKASR